MTEWNERWDALNRRIDEACVSLRQTGQMLEALNLRMDARQKSAESPFAAPATEGDAPWSSV